LESIEPPILLELYALSTMSYTCMAVGLPHHKGILL